HFVLICSVDERRLKGAIGSNDEAILHEWLSLLRKEGSVIPDYSIQAREEAARRLVAGDFAPGECDEGTDFGYAFEELCRAWANEQKDIECYVDEAFPQLWDLVTGAAPPFGLPTSPFGVPVVGWHAGPAVVKHRSAFAAVRSDKALRKYGGTSENFADIDTVL